MKKILLLFVSAMICILPSISQNIPGMSGARLCSQQKSAHKFLPDLRLKLLSGPTHSYDVLDYKLNLNIYKCYTSPYPKDYHATNIMTFLVVNALDSIQLNANNASLVIDSVRLAGVSFRHANDILTIHLNRIYQPGEVAQVKIGYHHTLVTDYSFNTGSGIVFTDCEPEGARNWFPCWDQPSDKATLDLTVKVPSNVKLGSNGALMDSLFSGDTLIYHWASSFRLSTYLMVMTSRKNYNLDIIYWHKPSNPVDSVPFRFYFNPGESPSYIESIIFPMTDYYSMRYTEHPYQKNGFATIDSMFVWGGMENMTLTSLCKNCWSESLVGHEFAHQWFGDMITCATWADIWLNEGFATWCEANWNEYRQGYSAYKSEIDNYAEDYMINNPGWAISVPEWAVITPDNNTLFNYQITYEKGACALHQIRYLLSDTVFFTAMRAYASDTNFRFKNASVADFNAKINQVSGNNYDWYFNDWIFQPNHPSYQNTYNFQDLGNNQWKVNFFTYQDQPSPAFFRMMVEVKITFSDNSDTTIRFMNDINYQTATWFFGKQPVSLLFDPDDNIVLKQETTVVGISEPSSGNGKFILVKNIPNPAANTTKIIFETMQPLPVKLEILDVTGKTLRSAEYGTYPSGSHAIDLDCSFLSPGVYFYKMTAGDETKVRKMVIAK